MSNHIAVDMMFVSSLVTKDANMARTLSKGLAPVVEQLELERPEVVTLRDIEGICAAEGVGAEPRVVASRLKKAGWLLPTGQRGAWEFAPAELAGPYSCCDPLLPAKALAAANPDVAPLLRGQTAAWAMGLADRVPSTIEVALEPGMRASMPDGMSACSYRTALVPRKAKGALSLTPEAVVVQMAERPSTVRSWASAAEWLPDVMAEMSAAATLEELRGRSVATAQRTGYLLQGERPDIAEAILGGFKPKSVARFGQGSAKRSSSEWMVVDSSLPWDPEKTKKTV